MKFRKGDIVTVKNYAWYLVNRDKEGNVYNTDSINLFTNKMSDLCGLKFEISDFSGDTYLTKDNDYKWEDWMLEGKAERNSLFSFFLKSKTESNVDKLTKKIEYLNKLKDLKSKIVDNDYLGYYHLKLENSTNIFRSPILDELLVKYENILHQDIVFRIKQLENEINKLIVQ